MTFKELGINAPLLRALDDVHYSSPTPIQERAIPPVLRGGDLVGCAQTGTGKTAAFALPILQQLGERDQKSQGKRPIRALVLTPTRELAIQIYDNVRLYSKYTKMRSAVIFGGVSQGPQEDALRRGVDMLIATPGRLWDLMGQGIISLDAVEVFVLDEADRMLDMGFIADVRRITAKLPKKRQNLLFSATMPKEIRDIVDNMLHEPTWVHVDPEVTTVEAIEQQVYFVDKGDKIKLLTHILRREIEGSVLVFTRTKHGADRVVRLLARSGITAQAIHGNKSQNARQAALNHFKKGEIRVLVATDIAARGIDIDQLPYVVNYDLPNIPETYVHRIGRTGRAGRGGTAIAFCDHEERAYLRDIEKLIGKPVPVAENTLYPASEAPPEPAAVVAPKPVKAGGENRNRRRRGPRRRPGTPPKNTK